MARPGQQLRTYREQLGLSMRDVVSRSEVIAERHQKANFSLSLNRICEIENGGVVPNVYRLYSFSVIYRRSFEELLLLYGLDLGESMIDSNVIGAPQTHLSSCIALSGIANIARQSETTHLGSAVDREVERLFPAGNPRRYSYGYIGTEDRTMSPLLTPGSLVQIDERSTRVTKGPWRSEFERPIYFLETRSGFRCAWCTVQDGQITLQPYSLSPETVRIYRHPQEAEVIGQVVGAVVRFPSSSARQDDTRTLSI